MMLKFFLLLLALAALYWIFRMNRKPPSQDAPRPPSGAETMVACAWCGVHLPQSESVVADDRHYCCDAHRERDAAD